MNYGKILFIEYNNYFLFFVCICLIVACIGKSAQIGLHIWLPEAMEGPTPVSSLIHAATMVTAGIYLIIKCSFLFDFFSLSIILIIGGVTAFFSSSIGVFQNDLKKIIAYSTCSQLGYMLLACGLAGFNNSFFHLYTHAFFKALLFLTAGYIIHAVTDDQDLRKMGSFIYYLPFCYLMMLYGSLSLMGFPMTSGFFSKESIILLFKQYYFLNDIIYENINISFLYNFFIFFEWFVYVSLIFTIWYSVKMLLLVFFYKNNNNRSYLLNYKNHFNFFKIFYLNFFYTFFFFKKKKYIKKLHYSTFIMLFSIYELADFSIYQGYLCKDMFIGLGSDFFLNTIPIYFNFDLFSNFLYIFSFDFNDYGIENAFFISMYMSFVFFFIYFFFFYRVYALSISPFFFFLLSRHLTEQYISFFKIFLNPILKGSLYFSYNFSFLVIEKGIVEWLGPYLLVNLISRFSSLILKKTPHFSNIYLGFLFIFINILFLFIFF
jgi:NADH-ubiquinone oxidoreductase chain 5